MPMPRSISPAVALIPTRLLVQHPPKRLPAPAECFPCPTRQLPRRSMPRRRHRWSARRQLRCWGVIKSSRNSGAVAWRGVPGAPAIVEPFGRAEGDAARVARNATFVARFTREAYAAAQLSHHNIVQIFDFGEDKGTTFFSMEYVDGQTLGGLLKQKKRLDPEEAVGYVLQAARFEIRRTIRA